MLEPIDDATLPHTFDLLVRGFPRRSRSFWERALDRVARYNRCDGQRSIGHLLIAKGKPVGVMLTLSDKSLHADGKHYTVTNLSSWYIEPEHRHLAPLMLRSLVRADDIVFTDLTPSDRVVPMLPLLGFKPLNAGIAIIALPVAALSPAEATRVIELEDVEPDALMPDTRSRLECNARFGATAAVLGVGEEYHPVLFVSRTLRHLPAAQLIYCEDNTLLNRSIGAIARFLLKKGKLILIIDIPPDRKAPGVHFPGRGLKFAKGGFFDNRTDYAGSELVIVGQ